MNKLILEEVHVDNDFLKWYNENKHLTFDMVMIGYYAIKEGLQKYIMKTKTCDILDELKESSIMKLFQEQECQKNDIILMKMENEFKREVQTIIHDKELENVNIRNQLEIYKQLYLDMKEKIEQTYEEKETINDLKKEICILKKTNYVKGNIGEQIILKTLQDYYPSFIITDMSKVKHSGDIQIQDPNDGTIIMFESKYKETITKYDVDKFVNDVTMIKNNGQNIKCAVFCSILTKNIPLKGDFYIEYNSNIPVLYCGFDNETDFMFWFPQYLKLINQLPMISNTNDEDSEDRDSKFYTLLDKIKPLITQVKLMKSNCEKIKNVHNELTNQTKNLFDSLTDMIDIDFHCPKCNRKFKSQKTLSNHKTKCL